MRPLPRLSPTAALLLAAPGVVLAVWGLLFGAGGLAPGAASLIAAGTTIPAAVGLAMIAIGRWPCPRPDPLVLIAGGGLALFALVAAISATWSLSPGRSVGDAILAAAYLGSLSLGVLLGPVLRRPGTAITAALTTVATVASAWALIARSFEGTTGVQFTPRLSGTLSLPNAMAILALAGLFGALALCAHRSPRLRAIGGAAAGVNAMALILTSSRSGVGLALIGIAVMQLVLPAAPRMRLVGLAAMIPAITLGLWIATWPAFNAIEKSVPAAGRGLIFAAIIAASVGAAIALMAPTILPGADPVGARARASRRTILAAAGVLVVLVAAVVVRAGGPTGTVEAIRAGFTGSVDQTGVRIGIGANLRDHWWQTAWSGFAASPLVGDGAGTFRLLEQTTQEPAYTTDSAHNTVLEVLAGTGLAGGAPFVVGAIALVAMAIRALRRAPLDDAEGTTVAVVAALAFLAQGLVDVDWDLAAQGVIAFAAIGAVTRAPRDPTRVGAATRSLATVGAIGLLVAGLLAIPFWLSARQTERSTRILLDDPQAALELAVSAERYNPLAIEPLLAAADARELLGDRTGAQAALLRAIDLEPSNFEPWLYYGTYLAFSWGEPQQGRTALDRALDLSGGDPSVLSVYESLPPS